MTAHPALAGVPAARRATAPVVVGIGDAAVGTEAGTIVTYGLGSCLGLAVYDPVARAGGLLHVMMPASSISPEKAERSPYLFVDTGVPLFFRRCYQLGAEKRRLVVKLAGGAAPNCADGGADHFQIGKRNLVQLRKLLWKNGVLLGGEDVGGTASRTLSVDLATGETRLRSGGTEWVF